MVQDPNQEPMALLQRGREALEQAPALYGRPLSPHEYWWLGVGLAAWILADQSGKPYVADRVEHLMDRLGQSGSDGDWLQQMVDELSLLDAEGLLWPCYHRSETGRVQPTGVTVYSGFGPQDAYYVALGHIGVALAIHRDDTRWLPRLTAAIGQIVESGVTESQEKVILEFFASQEVDG